MIARLTHSASGCAKGLLEEAGIPFHVLGDELGVRILTATPLINPWCRLQVPSDCEQEARAALRPLEGSGPLGDA